MVGGKVAQPIVLDAASLARMLLVDTLDGAPLGTADGPFRLVAPAEKRPGRWVRQVTRIDVLESAD